MGMTMLDWIRIHSNGDVITKTEFTQIRNCGSPEEIADAVSRMEEAGGYDNLED